MMGRYSAVEVIACMFRTGIKWGMPIASGRLFPRPTLLFATCAEHSSRLEVMPHQDTFIRSYAAMNCFGVGLSALSHATRTAPQRRAQRGPGSCCV